MQAIIKILKIGQSGSAPLTYTLYLFVSSLRFLFDIECHLVEYFSIIHVLEFLMAFLLDTLVAFHLDILVAFHLDILVPFHLDILVAFHFFT